MTEFKIIILDKDDELEIFLKEQYIRIVCLNKYEDLITSVKKETYDVAIINPDLLKENVEATIKLLIKREIPVLVTQEKHEDVEKIIEALSAGAFDYFKKPIFSIMKEEGKDSFLKELLFKITMAYESKDKIRDLDLIHEPIVEINYNFKKMKEKIIIIASSTGGPQSLEQMIPLFPKETPAPIIVVQHMPEIFTQKFAERLNILSNISVKEAEDGEEIKDGVCYIAKGDYHLELKKSINKKTIIKLNKKEKILGVRPCANVTMDSASKIFLKNVIGVIITGMGSDGTVGCKKVKEKGGIVIAESEKTSIIYGMPKSVIASGYYDMIVDLQKIPVAVLQALEI